MEFGRVPQDKLDTVDFKLPPDPSFNHSVLKTNAVAAQRVYVGCAKWGIMEWVGKIYPPKTREKDFLRHYVHHYNSVELNATHYKVYGPRAIEKWALQANANIASGEDFLFCPKMFQGVTHRGALKRNNFMLNEFLRGIATFGKHLGPVLVQVSDSFSPKRKAELFVFLKSLPPDLQFFVEVRHKDWFSKPQIRDELFKTLSEMNIGSVITDTAGRRDCAHMHVTIPKTFVRYVGNSLHPSDYSRISQWAHRIKSWLDGGMEEVYFFVHMHDEATSPELSAYLVDELNEICGLNVKRPQFIDSFKLPAPPQKSGLMNLI